MGPQSAQLLAGHMFRESFELELRNFLGLIRPRTYLTREDARRHVFESIEMLYNPKRKRTCNGMLSPVDFETSQQKLNETGVDKNRGSQSARRKSGKRGGQIRHWLRRTFPGAIPSWGCVDVDKHEIPPSGVVMLATMENGHEMALFRCCFRSPRRNIAAFFR